MNKNDLEMRWALNKLPSRPKAMWRYMNNYRGNEIHVLFLYPITCDWNELQARLIGGSGSLSIGFNRGFGGLHW